MKVYKTTGGFVIENDQKFYLSKHKDWDIFINRKNLMFEIEKNMNFSSDSPESEYLIKNSLLPPIQSQEIWAAGVTYFRSKTAREEESELAQKFYSMVYEAERPELFFKSTGPRAVGHLQDIHIRRDSKWNVPEPELTLFINSFGQISGFTIGNDVSSRDIEGENPLYLPQAKVYDNSAAIGPCIYLSEDGLSSDTKIELIISRKNEIVFKGETAISQIKRSFEELVNYLFKELSFPHGCFLMTGTGIVPPTDFTLKKGDEVSIKIDNIGTLKNIVNIKA